MSIILSNSENQRYDIQIFHRSEEEKSVEHKFQQIYIVPVNKILWEQNKAHFYWKSICFLQFVLCEQQGEKWWKVADTYTESTQYSVRDVIFHSLYTRRNWRCLFESRNSRQVWLKMYLRYFINFRTLNSFSIIAELKHTLSHKCAIFSTSRLFHCLLRSARTGSTRYQNTLSNKIGSARSS